MKPACTRRHMTCRPDQVWRRVLLNLPLFAAVASLASPVWGYSGNGCMNRQGDALPDAAHFVAPSESRHLQKLLDFYQRIRLAPGGDYRRGGRLVLRTGQELYGLANTRIPALTVSAGTNGAILSGVAPDAMDFEPSTTAIHHNCFERISTARFSRPLRIVGATVVDNLFLDFGTAGIEIDTRAGGLVEHNRFIRIVVHGNSPAIAIRGNPARPSRGNVFLWTNILTPAGDGITIDSEAEVTFVGLDAESWNWNHAAQHSAMMSVSNSGIVRAFMLHGGDDRWREGKVLDAGAQELQLFGTHFATVGSPPIVLRPDVRSFADLLSESVSIGGLDSAGFRLRGLPNGAATISVSGVERPDGQLSAVERSALRDMYVAAAGLGGGPWERPKLYLPPVPEGIVSAVDRPHQRDSTALIQALIERDGIAALPAGVYYISRPLRISNRQGLVGAGASRTALVAMRRDVDLIIGGDMMRTPSPLSFVLADLTLIGGHDGIHHDAHGSGAGAQYNGIVLSHVTFRQMSGAGIAVEGIYGWDNNLIDNVNFVDCDIGFRQVVPSWYQSSAIQGNVAGTTYLDKNVFYRVQFLGGRKGIEWLARRADNLNAFVNSRFSGTSEHAYEAENADDTLFVNSEFVGNSGDSVLKSDRLMGCVSCDFVASAGGKTMFGGDAICEGCSFVSVGSSRATIALDRATLLLLNCYSNGLSLGNIRTGMLINTQLPMDARLNHMVVLVRDARPVVILSEAPKPHPQLLVGVGMPWDEH